MFWLGGCSANSQRITSAPIRSSASSASIALPHDLCISRPVSSSSFSYASTRRYGACPTSVDRHEELRVEPEPDLLAHLRDPVGREPLLPVRVVGQVGAGQPVERPGRVSARHPLRVLPAERRERDDARVEPRVADLGDARDLLPARLTADRHLVDPRPVELLELLEPARRPRLELRARADHVQVPARARDRTAAAGRSSASARCSSRPCCAASRPSACR